MLFLRVAKIRQSRDSGLTIERLGLIAKGAGLHLAIWLAFALDLFAQTNPFPDFTVATAREYLHAVAKTAENQASHSAEAQLINARLENQLGQKAEAERLALAAFELDARRGDIQVFLADLYIQQDRLEEAAKALRRALEANPGTKGAQRRLGMVLDRLGDRAGALSAFEQAVAQAPEDAQAHLLLARMYLDQQRATDARVEAERACQLDAQSANARYLLYQTQAQLGSAEDAAKTLEQFRALKKSEPSAMDGTVSPAESEANLRVCAADFHAAIAGQLLGQGAESNAVAHLEQALRIAPSHVPAHELLANCYLRKGRWQEAKPILKEWVQLAPQELAAHLNLGTVLLQLKDPAGAEELRRALEIEPRQPQALNNLARFYLASRQQLPEALSLSQRLVALQPSGVSYDLLGWALFSNGKTNEALQAAAEAVSQDPANPTYRQRYERLKHVASSSP